MSSFGLIILIIYLAILLFSVVVHEVSHGAMADFLGDPTARRMGRLTLNPFRHLDFWGSFVVPLFMIFAFRFAIGWAKPVPYNPYNLRDQKYGSAKVGAAGPGSNLIVALFFGLFARFLPLTQAMRSSIISAGMTAVHSGNLSVIAQAVEGSMVAGLFFVFAIIIFLNILLAFFNLLPVPPLDGSKLLFALLPYEVSQETKIFFQKYGILILLALIMFGGINWLFGLVQAASFWLLGV